LCPLIFREIDRIIPRRYWRGLTFLDGFLGGGSVSLYAKAQGFRVVATDIAERAIVVGQSMISNSRVKLSREDILRLAAPSNAPPGRVEQQYVPTVFTLEQGRFLDRALAIAGETADTAKAALVRLLAIRVALLAHPMSQVRGGTIHRVSTGDYESITESCLYHYVDGLRLTRPGKLWELAQQLNAGVFQGEGQVLRANVLDVLPEIQADVAYLDPPYPGVMSYEREYKVIDEILEGASRQTSPFTAKGGAAMLDTLFERANHIPIWILSLGNAVVGIEELEAKMARFGRTTKAIAVKYQHLPAVATAQKKKENREFLVVGWDTEAALLRRLSVNDLGRASPFDDGGTVAGVHDHLGVFGAEGSTAKPLSCDRREESKPPFTEKKASSVGDTILNRRVARMIQTPPSPEPASASTVKGGSDRLVVMSQRSLGTGREIKRIRRESRDRGHKGACRAQRAPRNAHRPPDGPLGRSPGSSPQRERNARRPAGEVEGAHPTHRTISVSRRPPAPGRSREVPGLGWSPPSRVASRAWTPGGTLRRVGGG
jgi:hypothetical protein